MYSKISKSAVCQIEGILNNVLRDEIDNRVYMLKKFYEKIGLKEDTNNRQFRNGTTSFIDTRCSNNNFKVHYIFYRSGYYRRKRGTVFYQLNPTEKYTNGIYSRKIIKRVIIINRDEQMIRCLSNIINYRNIFHVW